MPSLIRKASLANLGEQGALWKNKRLWYGFIILVFCAFSIACCFVVEAPRVADPDTNLSNADIAWMLTSSALVLFMTPGVAFFYGGMVSTKNVISTMLQSFACMGIISVHWVLIGFSLAFGEDSNGFIGKPWTYWVFHDVGGQTNASLSPTIPLALYAVYQMMFAVITPALISGGLAERIRFPAFMAFITIWMTVVYCPIAHWTWHPEGFLRKWGVLDFAGGTVVHMSSGWAAFAGSLILGRRRVHKAKEQHVPANVPYVILGASMLWFGWFGFNAGSSVASNELAVLAFLTTNTATAMASITWIFLEGLQGKKLSAVGACTGAVVGLVSITPAAGYVSVQSSFFIGFFGAVMCTIACWIKGKTTLDDTLDAFSCHGVGGMTGLILTGFFAVGVGVTAGAGKTFGYHWLALVIVAAYSFFVSIAIYLFLGIFMPLRVDPLKEEQGLDVTQHGESFYFGAGGGNLLDASTCSRTSQSALMNLDAVEKGEGYGNGNGNGSGVPLPPPPPPRQNAPTADQYTPAPTPTPTPAYASTPGEAQHQLPKLPTATARFPSVVAV